MHPTAPETGAAGDAADSKHNAFPLRRFVRDSDRQAVRRLVEATRFFRADEVDVAVELVETRLEKGAASGYEFVFAGEQEQVLGYACYGPIPCTLGSWDLYWIAVDPAAQGQGLGRRLLDEAERQIVAAGGRQIYIETSGRPQYAPTRGFYERCGYTVASVLTDFYAPGDDKVTWRKHCSR